MKSVDLVLVDPPFDALHHTVREAIAAVNRDQWGNLELLHCSEADLLALWQELASTRVGSREWRMRGDASPHSVSAALVAVWWADHLDRRHVRLVGACTRRGVELPMPLPSPQYPALACLYPATSLMVSQHRRLRLLELCGCGVWGEPERLAWMGTCCGPCFDRLPSETSSMPSVLSVPGHVSCAAFSPDGKRLATADRAGIRLWDTTSATPLACWDASGRLGKLSFSPDSQVLAWSDPSQGMIHLQSIPDGKHRLLFGRTFAWGQDSEHLVIATPGGHLIEINPCEAAATWLELQAGGASLTARSFRMPFPVTCGDLAISPDGRTLAVAAGREGLLFWDVASGEPRARGHCGVCPGPVRWSPDGSALAVGVGAVHWKAVLWDVPAGRRRAVIGSNLALTDLAFTPEGDFLVTSEEDGLRIWEATSGQERRFLSPFDDPIVCFAFAANGRLVAVGTQQGTVRLWPADLLRPD